MNYALALQLKLAGFPQRMVHIQTPDRMRRQHGYPLWFCQHDNGCEYPSSCPTSIFFPSVGELIEGCGKNFHCLIHTLNGGLDSDKEFWSADFDNIVRNWETASSPEEAVARLWLALNKK